MSCINLTAVYAMSGKQATPVEGQTVRESMRSGMEVSLANLQYSNCDV